jgi:hypothetical protein
MKENVLAAVIRLDKAKAFLAHNFFDGSGHWSSLLSQFTKISFQMLQSFKPFNPLSLSCPRDCGNKDVTQSEPKS